MGIASCATILFHFSDQLVHIVYLLFIFYINYIISLTLPITIVPSFFLQHNRQANYQIYLPRGPILQHIPQHIILITDIFPNMKAKPGNPNREFCRMSASYLVP